MADIFLRDKKGACFAVLTVCDGYGEAIVDGRTWRWEFSRWGGPLWLKKDGSERKCQVPTKKNVWAAFEKWLKEYEAGLADAMVRHSDENTETSCNVGSVVAAQKPTRRGGNTLSWRLR